MKKILIASFTFVLTIGTIGVILYTVFGQNATYIKYETTYNNIGWYTIDLHGYITGIDKTINSIIGAQFIDIPSAPTLNWMEWWIALANVFIYVINNLITGLNIIFAPVKIIIYLVIVICAIFGINTGNTSTLEILTQIYSLRLEQIAYV